MYQFISEREKKKKTKQKIGVDKNRCSEVPLVELRYQSFKIPV